MIYIYDYEVQANGSVIITVNIGGAANLDGHLIRITPSPGFVQFVDAAATQEFVAGPNIFMVEFALICPETGDVLATVQWRRS